LTSTGVKRTSGYHFDDTRRYLDAVESLNDEARYKIFEGNARKVFPRLNRLLDRRAAAQASSANQAPERVTQ